MKKSQGFTVIELLIVMALLSALMLGLVRTLEPWQYLYYLQDERIAGSAGTLKQALRTYGQTHPKAPWCLSSLTCELETLDAQPLSTKLMKPVLEELVAARALPLTFVTDHPKEFPFLLVSGDKRAETVSVCFLPRSKTYKGHTYTKYEKNGTLVSPAGSCSNPKNPNECYWCAP